EDRLLDSLREPNDGFTDQGFVPFHRPEDPGALAASQGLRGRLVDKDLGVGMLLQEAGGYRSGDRPLDGLCHDAGLSFAEGKQDDLVSVENGANPHGDGTAGDVLLTEKVAGGVATGHPIEGDEPGHAVATGAGFVEAD